MKTVKPPSIHNSDHKGDSDKEGSEKVYIPHHLQMPDIEKYSRDSDPILFIDRYPLAMGPLRLRNDALLKIFPRYLNSSKISTVAKVKHRSSALYIELQQQLQQNVSSSSIDQMERSWMIWKARNVSYNFGEDDLS